VIDYFCRTESSKRLGVISAICCPISRLLFLGYRPTIYPHFSIPLFLLSIFHSLLFIHPFPFCLLPHYTTKKKLFGYSSKYCSVTEMLLALGLPSFNTEIHNHRKSFLCVRIKHNNDLLKLLRCVSPSTFL